MDAFLYVSAFTPSQWATSLAPIPVDSPLSAAAKRRLTSLICACVHIFSHCFKKLQWVIALYNVLPVSILNLKYSDSKCEKELLHKGNILCKAHGVQH